MSLIEMQQKHIRYWCIERAHGLRAQLAPESDNQQVYLLKPN